MAQGTALDCGYLWNAEAVFGGGYQRMPVITWGWCLAAGISGLMGTVLDCKNHGMRDVM